MTLTLVAVTLAVPVPGDAWVARLLLGWTLAAVVFCAPLLHAAGRLDADATARRFRGGAGGRTETDVVVVGASLASLVAVGAMLLGGGSGGQDRASAFESLLAVLAVAASWCAVHTVYALRYARHCLVNEPDAVDWPGGGAPRLSDFVYLAFTLGMTYQVSDTDLQTPAIRRLVLHHTLLSYVFGTVVVATTINLVVGVASGG